MKLSCTKYMLFLAIALLLLSAAACTQSKPVVPTQTLPPLQTTLEPQAVSTEATPSTLETAPAAVSTQPPAEGTSAPTESAPLPTVTLSGQPLPAETQQPGQPLPAETPAVVATAAPTAAQPPAVSQPTTGACTSPYTVQAGEWLAVIARKCGVTTTALISANPGINPNYVFPGQKIAIPGASSGGKGTAPGGTTGGRYTVRLGDTMFSIARRFGVTVNALMAANGINNPNYLFAGQVLVIP